MQHCKTNKFMRVSTSNCSGASVWFMHGLGFVILAPVPQWADREASRGGVADVGIVTRKDRQFGGTGGASSGFKSNELSRLLVLGCNVERPGYNVQVMCCKQT